MKKVEMENHRLRAGGASKATQAVEEHVATKKVVPQPTVVESFPPSAAAVAAMMQQAEDDSSSSAVATVAAPSPSNELTLLDSAAASAILSRCASLSSSSNATAPAAVDLDGLPISTPLLSHAPSMEDITAAGDVGMLTEAERKVEMERRLKRRAPKKNSTPSTGGGAVSSGVKAGAADARSSSPPPKGFYVMETAKPQATTAVSSEKTTAKGSKPPTASKPTATPAPSAPAAAPAASASGHPESPEASSTSRPLDPSLLASPFLDPFLPAPKSLSAAKDLLASQRAAMQQLVDMVHTTQSVWEARINQHAEVADARAARLEKQHREAQAKVDALAETSREKLTAEQEKYDALFANHVKTEAQLKQLKSTVAMLRAKVG